MNKAFRDFLDLPKHQFMRKYLLLPAIVAMLAFTVWQGAVLVTPLDSLTRTEGNVSAIDSVVTSVKNKPLFKEVYQELRLSVVNHAQYFTTESNAPFNYITSTVNVGDRVSIYYDVPFHKWFTGTSSRIYQLEKNGQVLISFKEHKRKSYAPLWILIIMVVGFTVYYLYWRLTSSY